MSLSFDYGFKIPIKNIGIPEIMIKP